MVPRALPFALAALLVVLDQLTKAWVVAEVPLGARVASWLGLVHLTHVRNAGAAFGLLRDLRIEVAGTTIDGVQVLGLVSLAAAVALAVWLLRDRQLTWGTRLALGTVMGGAFGNGVDRWRLHYVVDFVHLQAGWFDFPVFNVADTAITLGAVWLLLATAFPRRRDGAGTAAAGEGAAGGPPADGPPADGPPADAGPLSDAPSGTAGDR